MEQTEDHKSRGCMSSYAFFVKEIEENFKKDHPGEEIEFIEFAKKCSYIWRKMGDSEKEKYAQMAEVEMKKFDSETANYAPSSEVNE